MKLTVWTKWGRDSILNRPKCIFKDDDFQGLVPRKGDTIFVKDGFGGERVNDVYIHLFDNSVELHIDDADEENEYGPCLMFSKENEEWSKIMRKL